MFEQPPCPDGHGPDCPERACVDCGTAVLVGPDPAPDPARARDDAPSRPSARRTAGASGGGASTRTAA
ncbi:hypothetical protein [Actinomadura rifamycini]|uniref:hypothetical protein n=1 Tax=Actinomadura rifamycini TaxID=31962 RepID=UPI0007E8B999|nr:hypothetical protein [Actinomadura rifamycini]